MIKFEITAEPRHLFGRKVKNLRKKGITPANVFGHQIKSVSFQIETKSFLKLYPQIGESTLVYLKITGEDILYLKNGVTVEDIDTLKTSKSINGDYTFVGNIIEKNNYFEKFLDKYVEEKPPKVMKALGIKETPQER